jgi:hypothetical protein
MKTHCGKGHEFTPENTGFFKSETRSFRFCIQCSRDRASKSQDLDPQASRDRKNEWQCQKLYGVTLAKRDALLASQGDACAICGRTGLTWGKGFNDVWHIDHEHGKEGTHRGILCATCNLALGKLEPYMNKVLEYLAKHKGNSNGNLNSKNFGHNGLGQEILIQSSIGDR